MKKILCGSLAVLLVAAGCSGGSTSGETTSEDAYYVFSTDVQTLDWHMSQRATDAEITANCVDALTETNSYNNYIGALAESWEANDDKTVWTFHLRDANWVTNTGEVYGAVTADDFVAGLQHLADFDGPTMWIAGSFVEGLADYDAGNIDFSEVGVKAVDDKTVEYTLTAPTPFFNTIVANNSFWPVNREFLESKGDGCKLGEPDPANCGYGSPTDPSTILYNGAYIIDELVSKSSQKLHKNENYWDAEHVYVNKISRVYDDGSDPASTVKGFEQAENPYYMATLLTTAPDFEQYLEQYKDYAFTGIQNAYSFGMNFNLNRVNYENSNKTAAQFEDTKAALLNAHFRRALKFGLDRVSYMATAVDPSIAEKALRTIECPWDFVTTSDGVAYGELVQAASEDPTVDLSEGQDSIYDPEKAKAELEAAKAELTDVSWPIILDLLVDEASSTNISQASSLEQSIEASLGKENVDIQIHPVDDDTYTGSSYTSNGPQDACWDISTSTGWGYDYVDPKSYLSIFSPVNGDVLTTSMGLNYYQEDGFDGIELVDPNGNPVSSADANAANDAAIEKSGLLEYQKMIDAAYAINDDLDERYKAEAAAEAYLLDNALYINIQTQTRSVNWSLTRIVPFTNSYLNYSKMKRVVIQKDPVTAQEYNAAYEQWKVDKAEDAKANA